MASFSRLLRRAAEGWVGRIAPVAFFGFILFVLPWQAGRTEEYANGATSPDSSFLYTAGDMYAAALAVGADGRHDYVVARLTFDVVWPLVYAIFLSTAISWFLARVLADDSRWHLLNLVPWLALLLDYAENFCAAVVIGRYPSKTPVLADVATFFTMAKWLVLSAAFIVLAVALVMAITNRFRATRGEAT